MDHYDALYGKPVIGSDGERIGTLSDLYAAEGTDKPTLATVATGWFGSKSSFFPLTQAKMEGDDIVVPYTKDKIKDAPTIDPDAEVSDEESQALYDYYELGSMKDDIDDTATDETVDMAGSITLSEEELNVGKRTVETGRYRLKKYVVTEHVTQTVPVQREEVRLIREPIDGGNVDEDVTIGEDTQEVITHAEVPVVEKNAVAKERVGFATDVVNDEAVVDEEVRKERLEVDSDAGDIRR